MAQTQLITAYEVIRYSPAGRDYPETHVCDRIALVEETLWNKCFGWDFYDYMITKISPLPTGQVEWEVGQSYAINQWVIRDSCSYKSLAGANTTDPLTDTTNWERHRKFTDDCLNELWEGYLRQYLAFKIYAGSLIYTTHNSTAGGLVIRSNEDGRGGGTRVASKGEIIYSQEKILSDIQDIYDNMISWLKKNKTDCLFPTIKVLDESCGTDCIQRKSKRRWAFKTAGSKVY